MQNVALVAQGTCEKKEGKEVTEENTLAVKHMKRYVSQEIERRKAKEKLKKHLGSNYHQYKKMQMSTSLSKTAQISTSTATNLVTSKGIALLSTS